MSDYIIAQREYFTEGPVASPAVFENMGRYRSIAFVADTITAVEGSIDGSTFVDITALGTAFAGGIVFSNVCFKAYRVIATGDVRANAN